MILLKPQVVYRYSFQATIFLHLLGRKTENKKIKQSTFEPETLIQDKFPLQCECPQTWAAVNRAREYRASSPVTFGHSGLNGSAAPDKNTHGNWFSPCAAAVSTSRAVENTHRNVEEHSV